MMIKCDFCISEQKGDLPDGILYTKYLNDFSPLFSKDAACIDVRFDEHDVCYAVWTDGVKDIRRDDLQFKYCPMCGRKLRPTQGWWTISDDEAKRQEKYLEDAGKLLYERGLKTGCLTNRDFQDVGLPLNLPDGVAWFFDIEEFDDELV